MNSEGEFEEITAILGAERVAAIRADSVERERLRYSNDDLWAWFLKLESRQIEIMEAMPYYHKLIAEDDKDAAIWRIALNRLAIEFSAAKPVMDCIRWHLEQRGDLTIGNWKADWDENYYSSLLGWWQKPWGIE